jgi:hypothetical protein
MLGAGIEPAWEFIPRDFKSLASTSFATRAQNDESDACCVLMWAPRIAAGRRPLTPRRNEAGKGTRTRDPNLGKVVLYQLSYSRKQ